MTRFSLYHLVLLPRNTVDISSTLILSIWMNHRLTWDSFKKKTLYNIQDSILSIQSIRQQHYGSPPCTWFHCTAPIQYTPPHQGLANYQISSLVLWGKEIAEEWLLNDLCIAYSIGQETTKPNQTQSGSGNTYGPPRWSMSNPQYHPFRKNISWNLSQRNGWSKKPWTFKGWICQKSFLDNYKFHFINFQKWIFIGKFILTISKNEFSRENSFQQFLKISKNEFSLENSL